MPNNEPPGLPSWTCSCEFSRRTSSSSNALGLQGSRIEDGVLKGESALNKRRFGVNGNKSGAFDSDPHCFGVVRFFDGVRNISGLGKISDGSSGGEVCGGGDGVFEL